METNYKPSVLIADASEKTLQLFKQNLEKNKCKIYYANNYKDSVNLLDLKKIDLIVTDLYLGGGEQLGLQFAIKAKEVDANIQIIIIAEIPDISSVRQAAKIDVYDYLQKPIQVPAVSRASTRAIEKRLLLDERDELKRYVDEINRKLKISNEKYKKFTEELRLGQFEVEEQLNKEMTRLRKELKSIQTSGTDNHDESK